MDAFINPSSVTFGDSFPPRGSLGWEVTFGDSCLAQMDSCAAVSNFACICKIAKSMCAQKPHRGYLHDAHICS